MKRKTNLQLKTELFELKRTLEMTTAELDKAQSELRIWKSEGRDLMYKLSQAESRVQRYERIIDEMHNRNG